jgi:predicted dinucleotide-binding enzyme
MKLGIIGTGIVGQTIAAKLSEIGHDVMIGTRDVDKTLARTEPDKYGNPPFSEWKKQHPKVQVGTFSDSASHGEILINATDGSTSLNALKLTGMKNIQGKILMDIANPLDFSQGFPPSLSVCNKDSLGEQIQKAFPEAKVVKTLNTMNCSVMVNPDLVPGDHTVFLSGNDPDAKGQVARCLSEWFGWTKKNMIDLGNITTARGTEMLLPIWVRLYGALENAFFNFHIAIGQKP